MQQVERLGLDHVLQSVSALEAVVLRSFGPCGGQVLFTRDTGQVMLSRSGSRILTALRLEHPLARMVVECVWKHSAVTGDGAKSFVLLLASLLRGIEAAASREMGVSRSCRTRAAEQAAAASRLAERLLAFGLEELDDAVGAAVDSHRDILSWEGGSSDADADARAPTVHRLLRAFFHTRVGRAHSDCISRLTFDLLSHWACPARRPSSILRFINSNFPALHTAASGFPTSCSRLMEGQVIHRDFSTPHPPSELQPISAVAISVHLRPSGSPGDVVLEVGGRENGGRAGEEGGDGILKYTAWAERSIDGVVRTLHLLGVSLLLSAVKQCEAALALARLAGVSVVECIAEDELSLFAYLSGVEPVSDCRLIGREHVASLAFCKPVVLGAHRYVHVAFSACEERLQLTPHSLVICGPGEGQTEQSASAVQDALKMLLTTWQPVIRAGTAPADERPSPRSRASGRPNMDILSGSASHAQAVVASSSARSVSEPGWVVPGGGTFEFLLHHALRRRSSVREQLPLLADALLSVPQWIHPRHPRRPAQAHARLLSRLRNHSRFDRRSGSHAPLEGGDASGHDVGPVPTSDWGLDSVSCKHQLILAVLQCARGLLRADALLRTRAPLQTEMRALSNSRSLEDTEESDEESG